MSEVNRKYSSGKVFWGIFFLSIGSLFLLAKNDYSIDLPNNLIDYWPVLIILLGLSILLKGTILKPIISAFSGLLAGLILFSLFFGTQFNSEEDENIISSESSLSTYSENYNPDTKVATLSLKAGAGNIKIKSGTSKLIDVKSIGYNNTLSFNTRYRDNNARVVLRNASHEFNILDDSGSRNLNIKLNSNPVWKFNLKLGAAKVNMDLSDIAVSDFVLSTGATSSEIKFGDKNEEIKVDVEMGAATLDILIPKESGCLIKGDMVLVAKNLEGFDKIGNRRYKTRNFDSAGNKIIINFDGGVSTFKIERY